MVLFLFWVGFAIIVGVGANTRGRNGPGWGALAVLISPLLAGLLLLALPRGEKRDPTAKRVSNWEHWKDLRLTADNKSFYTGVSVWVVLLLIVGIGIVGGFRADPPPKAGYTTAVPARAVPAKPIEPTASEREAQERREREAKFDAVRRGDFSFCEAFKSELQEFTGIQSPCLK